MSDQREMTLDEYLESKLPDFHLARRQLQELREENEALAAHVVRLTACANAVYAANNVGNVAGFDRLIEAVDEPPTTSLARLKAEWQAEALERLRELLQETHMDKSPSVSRAAMHVDDAINRVKQECKPLELRRQAEEPTE